MDNDLPVSPRPSLSELFSRLIAEGETFIHAEIRLYRARAGRKLLSAGLVAGLIGCGVMLAQAAVVALLIGIILAIAPQLGFGWATAVVFLGATALSALLIYIAISRVKSLIRPEDEA